MRDDIELIEVIDADPGAFGMPVRATVTADPEPRPRRRPSRRHTLVAVGVAAVAALLVVALFAWKPWYDDPRLVLADAPVATSELTDHLVLGIPLDGLRATTLQDDGSDSSLIRGWPPDAVGHFLADPGASFTNTSDQRWFGFYGVPEHSERASTIFSQGTTIAGAPAEVSSETDGYVQLAWGPVDGWVYTAAAANIDVPDALAIAEQVRIEDGRPVLLDRGAANGLVPAGAFGDYARVMVLVQFAQNNNRGVTDITGLYYGFEGKSLVSMEANESALDILPFVLNSTPHEGTVHDLPAVGYTRGSGPFGGSDVSMIFWWEGGRLIMVSSDDDVDATFELAETTRVATSDEWSQVLSVG